MISLDYTRTSTAPLAYPFGEIDSFLLIFSLRSPRKRGQGKTSRRNQLHQQNTLAKLLKYDPEIQIIYFTPMLTIWKIQQFLTEIGIFGRSHFIRILAKVYLLENKKGKNMKPMVRTNYLTALPFIVGLSRGLFSIHVL